MGWAYTGTDYYGREIGYGIEATCDKRGCDEEINRGLGCICGDMHHGPFDMERGCGRYFCDEHLGWLGPRGGCSHKGKQVWGKTKCQLMEREERTDRVLVEGHYEWPSKPVYYCACREWKYEGPPLPERDPRKEFEDPYLANHHLVPGFDEHVAKRHFVSYMKGDETFQAFTPQEEATIAAVLARP